MTKRLIINADDLGYAGGTVPATYLRDHPGLGAGVHLVMNDGRPPLPPEQVGSLVDAEGCFRDGTQLLLRYGRLRTSELEAEWRSQIERFIAATGRPPDHLDLHCHYPYVFPAWFRVSLELAQEYGHLPVRVPFDDALDRKAGEMTTGSGFPVWYVRRQGRRYQRLVEQCGLKRPNYFEMSFSREGHRTTEHLLGLLDALLEGITELLAHPGTKGWRAGDYRALLDPRVRERIEELGIALISYGDLGS